MINPCFVIHNWPADTRATLYVNGKKIPEGSDFRQGIESRWSAWEAVTSLVVWIRSNSKEPVCYTIGMRK